MTSRDFLARLESLKIEIKPDVMKEIEQQLVSWPEDRAIAYNSTLVQLLREQAGSSLERTIGKMVAGERPDLMDKKMADAVSYFSMGLLRVYQIEDLKAAQIEEDHEAQG